MIDERLSEETTIPVTDAEYFDYKRDGSLDDRYAIYLEMMKGTGAYIKTYDEWLDS